MKKVALFSLVLGLALGCPRGAVLAGPASIPFSDTFEGYTNGTPLVNGTNGWYASETNVIVQTNIASTVLFLTNGASTNAALIPLDSALSNRFIANSYSNIWIQFDTRLVKYEGEDILFPAVNTNLAMYFYVSSSGYFVVHDGPPTPTNWVTLTTNLTGGGAAAVTETNWVRIDIHHDYVSKTWDLFVNYVLMTNHIGFINTNISALNSIGYNNGALTTYLDNVWVNTSAPPDLAQHGENWLPYIVGSTSAMACSIMEGVVAFTQTYAIWETNGYYALGFTNTISGLSGGQNWLTLSPATGTSTGDHKSVTVTYSTVGLPPGTYTGLITVAGSDTTFGFTAGNSPLSIPVSMTVETNTPVISVSPKSFTQTIMKGNNPTNQTFRIWNGSGSPVVPMTYTLACNATNFSLSITNGVSSGEADLVGVIYSDMSGYLEGTYSGQISIRAWDVWPGYMPTGAVIQTTNIMVSVQVVGPETPSEIWASDGTDTSKVSVRWNTTGSTGVMTAASYELWRYTTFDVAYAGKIANVIGTNYDDTSALAGTMYYYWVRPVNEFEVTGTMSVYDTGYRALLPPQDVFATDGLYTNRVVVTWSVANQATSYEVYRSLGAAPGAGILVYHTDGIEFSDMQVADGLKYWYQVKAVKGQYASELNAGDGGYLLSKPTGMSATKGTYATRVRVSWNTVEGAAEYEVWRNSAALSQSSAKVGNAISTTYDDTSMIPGTLYYYWVKAKSAKATSGFSGSDNGYAATGAVNVAVWDLVMLPAVLPAGSHPVILSFRMGNNGPSDLAAPNTAMGLDFHMGWTTDINQAVSVGSVGQDVTLPAGTSAVVKVNSVSGVTMPSEAGDYYVFVRAAPVWPNLLADESGGNNVTMGVGIIRVTAGGTAAHYWAVNDYDGDGISDLAVYEGSRGMWSVRTADGRVLGENVPFGGASFTPVVGDYDGDRNADPAIYDAESGTWAVMLSGSGYAMASAKLGETGCVALPGDYDGDGKADPVVYQEFSGMWAGLLSGSGYTQASGQFGAPGYQAVAGDYNGDGLWDLAVYQESTGYWFIRTPDAQLLKWGAYWGSPGYQPVSGDYDGDGIWDLAVYSESTGHWYIQTMAGVVLAAAKYWGSPGYMPVSGDYNGDGIWDLAVYHTSDGIWYVTSLKGQIILFNSRWGSSAATPVKW